MFINLHKLIVEFILKLFVINEDVNLNICIIDSKKTHSVYFIL